MKTNAVIRAAAAVLALLLIWAGFAPAYGAGAADAGRYRIVAIGDSLSVGYEPNMTEASVPYGFVDRLYEQALFHGRAEVANFGILGLRTEGLNRLLQGAADGRPLHAADIQDFSVFADARMGALAEKVAVRTPELRTALSAANLVTVTIGANDFSDFLRTLLAMTNPDDAVKALDENFPELMHKYADEAEQTIRMVHQLSPQAKILFADQYLPLPRFLNPKLYDVLYEKAVDPLTETVDDLVSKLKKEGLDAGSVHVSDSFKGKEGLYTWMRPLGINPTQDIHPSQEGYQAMAETFAQAIWGAYRSPAKRPAGIPASIVIAGRELTGPGKPAAKNNAVYFAAQDTAKALGAEFKWDAKKKTLTFKKNGRTVALVIGAKTLTGEGAKRKLDHPAFLQQTGKSSTPYVAPADIAAALQFEVVYRSTLQTYFINH